MPEINKIAIIGGDKRFLYLAEMLADTNKECAVFGLDEIAGEHSFTKCSCLCDALRASDAVLLPYPMMKDERYINAPYSKQDIPIKDIISLAEDRAIILHGGARAAIRDICDKRRPDIMTEDYAEREPLLIMNAQATAEGAIACAVTNHDKTLFESKILICGYGRIGKCLARLLSQFACELYVSARKPSDLAYIRAMGATPLMTDQICDAGINFDIIFNTIPQRILNNKQLDNIGIETLIIELSSKPYGVAFKFKKDGVRHPFYFYQFLPRLSLASTVTDLL